MTVLHAPTIECPDRPVRTSPAKAIDWRRTIGVANRKPDRMCWHHRPGLRRPAAGPRLCCQGLSGPRLRHRRGQGRPATQRRKLHRPHPGGERAGDAGDGFEATDDFGRLREADVVIICVPTPLTEAREPDLTYVVNSAKATARALRPGQLVVLESTTYPGTTRQEVLPILEASGLKAGDDFFLAFSPEREDPGNPNFSAPTIPKVVGGLDPASLELACALYGQAMVRVVPVSTPEVAEACKILENTYRAVNIALVNELKMLYDRMGIDVWEVIDAAKTKPFGFQAFYPGPGLGGHCIPIDPFYLTWVARKYGLTTRFIELAGEINTAMPAYVVSKIADALNDRGKPVKGSKITLLGMAYKKDVDDPRESPGFELMDLLLKKGASSSTTTRTSRNCRPCGTIPSCVARASRSRRSTWRARIAA